ncbi:RnfABCDGE type electron transport complex subunit D [Sedimentimonas flavescens]|uniref:RnfABCDGE type electron transport complex subunit D n=1 Tax=Sedimentimonas flavescens TaxID=2851012 RepID=UPI001C49E42F|nr:RnfABCDGE type electron transport complex subunit D [Sedimentimonas flavescens]MBW0159578.1 RnfABCDGE type electron transport complex subunit D [Sedimentimonas flavescens]
MRRGLWDREMVALMLLMAMMPMTLAWLWFGGAGAFWRLVFTLFVSGGWHIIFMLARAQQPSFAGALTGIAVAMLAPYDLSLFQLVLGISFGSVMAELVFGGWGRNVLNPATVTLAFLGFGFPAAHWPDFVLPVSWAALPALAMGVIFGVISPRLILGALSVMALAFIAGAPVAAALPAAAIVLALLVSDPVASASTRVGGWLNGALYAGLIVLFATGWHGAAPMQIAVAAALLASLAAPLLDETAIALWAARRRKRHG